jgi:hypothetical protein
MNNEKKFFKIYSFDLGDNAPTVVDPIPYNHLRGTKFFLD